jgi:hypothetical protein
MEIAVMPAKRLRTSITKILAALEPGGNFWIVPIDLEITREVAL